MTVQLLTLVPNVELPRSAPASTRARVPAGYGVQEQCLPFTAAAALGFLIPSPITFGLSVAADVPSDCHMFRSPLERPSAAGVYKDPRVFYVADQPKCRFERNAFSYDPLDFPKSQAPAAPPHARPGISFFDRADQVDVFKLHLPYIWLTPPNVDTLFVNPINRAARLDVLSGLVETDWYAEPVNLVLRKPPLDEGVHIASGDIVAQVIFIHREHRKPILTTLPEHARARRELHARMRDWYRQHARDRSAYKKLVRSHHGRFESRESTER